MKLTTASPVEIDSAIAAINSRGFEKLDRAATLRDWAAGRQKSIDGGGLLAYQIPEYEAAIAKMTAEAKTLRAEARAIFAETDPFDAEFRRRGGWDRYVLVDGGHIHNHRERCSTLRPTTRVGWLPNYSGSTPAEMIESFRKIKEGAATIMCTVCFPDAPVEWTTKPAVEGVCTNKGWDAAKPKRTGYYTGNWATCSACGQRGTLTKAGNLLKHKSA